MRRHNNRWRFADCARRRNSLLFWSHSFVLTVQFLQHMLHLVIGVTGAVCCVLHMDSDEEDAGATLLVESGSTR